MIRLQSHDRLYRRWLCVAGILVTGAGLPGCSDPGIDTHHRMETTGYQTIPAVTNLPDALVSAGRNTTSERTPVSNNKTDLRRVYGRIQIVDHFPDFRVKVVDHFPDLRVKRVMHFADGPGKWQIVDHFPDYKIQLVDHFPDFTIQWVDHFPGVAE